MFVVNDAKKLYEFLALKYYMLLLVFQNLNWVLMKFVGFVCLVLYCDF